MMTVPIKAKHLWNTLQEPRCPSYFPAGYLLLLSALDNGWRIAAIELKPSWDQHGFIYLLTLRHPSHAHSQHLVLPKNAQVEALLVDQALALVSQAAPLAV
jgi:hypothetical protein